MTKWRNNTINAEELMRFTTTSGWLQPLFHHWMRLKGPEQAKGIHLNNLGWFDFKSTWIEPEIQTYDYDYKRFLIRVTDYTQGI